MGRGRWLIYVCFFFCFALLNPWLLFVWEMGMGMEGGSKVCTWLTHNSIPPPSPPLGLSLGMRLHVPTHYYAAAACARPAVHAACISIPRQVAVLPLPRGPGTVFRHLFAIQLPRARLGYDTPTRTHPGVVCAAEILLAVWLCGASELDV